MSSKGRGRSTHPMTTARGRSWKISRKGCGRSMKSGSWVRLSSDSTSCPPSLIEGEGSMAWGGGRTLPPSNTFTHLQGREDASDLQVTTKGLSRMHWHGCSQLPSLENSRHVGQRELQL
ncbi:hypothetical protein KIL84_021291 [Mauremys mutica]|uniref:Uncharacterized protein n=1 Tax=Mauremys mutica TaxID=74926 RepID=A0A9D3XAQ4_9SAUR|nr:hypothetical protein KIL84_021291 [Mauremys mutica]